MFSLNRVSIIGYQTQPFTVRQTPGGTSVVDLNLVVPYAFRAESGEELSGKGFHTVTLWGPMADVAGRYLHAGSQVFISGRLQTDSWEDEKTAEKRSKTKIIAMDMILLDPKGGLPAAPEGAASVLCTLNRADVVGNVTRDPEIRQTTGGQQVLTLGVATNERWKDKATGADRERTEFHNVVVWGAQAMDVSKAVRKGNRVHVAGRGQTRGWETKDGQKRSTTEIVADRVSLLGVKHPAAESAIEASMLRQASVSAPGATADRQTAPPSSSAAPASAMTKAAPRHGSEPAAAEDITPPEVAYASEVKVEDLPF